jgi:hypothetical protein
MAVAETVTIYGTVTGLQSGGKQVGPYAVPSPANPTDLTSGQTTTLTLANGDNTITIPSTNCTAAIISFAPTSLTTKKLKNVAGDSGITVNPVGVCMLSFPGGGTTAASFIINSSAVDTGLATEILFL